jgi:hypothetical protein
MRQGVKATRRASTSGRRDLPFSARVLGTQRDPERPRQALSANGSCWHLRECITEFGAQGLELDATAARLQRHGVKVL